MQTIEQIAKRLFVEHLGVDASEVTDKANIVDDLGADSLDEVELVMAFEEEFGVEIADDEAETIVTVSDAIRWVEKHKPDWAA